MGKITQLVDFENQNHYKSDFENQNHYKTVILKIKVKITTKQ